MAQTQPQQYPSQPSLSPPAPSPSNGPPPGTNNNLGPPLKRQRLSPLQPPPQSQPQIGGFGTLQFSQPGSSPNGMPLSNAPAASPPSLQPAPIVTNAPPPPGSMGPPLRPVDTKPTDAADLTDVLASSGIDVREEEAFLTSGYGIATASFASQASAGPIMPGRGSFHEPAFKPASSQSPVTPSASSQFPGPAAQGLAGEIKLREDTNASRREQYPLHSAFLQTASLGRRVQKWGSDLGVRIPTDGHFRPSPDRPAAPIEVVGPDGNSVVRTGKSVLTTDAPLGDMIALITLACEERLRIIVEHSLLLSRNRRTHSHGIIPHDWNGLAEDNNGKKATEGHNGETATVLNGKRSVQGTSSDSQTTVTFPNTLALKSRRLIEKEGLQEAARANKRAKLDAASSSGAGRAGSVSALATSVAELGDRAPDAEKKTKKEMKKAEAKVNDAVQHQHAIETARMATGGSSTSRFGGKKVYSWLTGNAGPSASRTSFSAPRAKPGQPVQGPGQPGNAVNGARAALGKRLGEWREDNEHGAGIQIRDILFMLELDGKAAKHLQKAYSKESKEEVDRPGR